MLSRQAQIITRTMKRMNLKKLGKRKAMAALQRTLIFEEPGSTFRSKYPVEVYRIKRFKCVFTSSAQDTEPLCHIIYFHGGSYTYPAVRAHWHIVDSILSRVNAELTFVNYPLSPENTCEDAIEVAYATYKNVAANYSDNIVLMGDSAGGGLALALAQYIRKKDKKIRPKKLVLLSPWLDISMETEISDELDQRDLVLDADTLKMQGQRYAGEMNTKNYLCSPLFGRLKNLGDVAVFTGTSDILYSQAEAFKSRMKRYKHKIYYYEYRDMFHVWMGYPIPEAREAFDDIALFLKTQHHS